MKEIFLFVTVWLIVGCISWKLLDSGHWITAVALIVILLCGTSIKSK